MDIIIGRNQTTRQLNIVKDGNAFTFGKSGSVPMDVSRQHISLKSIGEAKWQLRNLNEKNVTFVNGVAVESKAVSSSDKVELGNSHYLFPWESLKEPKAEEVDIRPLKRIWDEYQQEEISIRKRQKNNGLLASIPLGFSMLGGIIAAVAPEIRIVAIAFTLIAFIVFIYGLFRRSQDNSIVELKNLEHKYSLKYCCPKCKHSFPLRHYDIITQNDVCPFCKTKLKK